MFNYTMDKDDYYTSNMSTTNSLTPASTPSTPSGVATDEAMAAGSRLYRARLIVENHLYDQLLNRYRLAVTRLRELAREANTLHEENEWLRLANEDLARRLSSLPVGPTVGDRRSSPRSVIQEDHVDGDDYNNEERVSLPRSISVRSPTYFKLLNPYPVDESALDRSLNSSQHVNGRKLRVRKEEKAIEMDVFNQGMYKTELCNKWQETGTCPYGDHCQFAHGLSELRPVIRHPRYKTQVCRMVLAGITCPYGHRCHFRHSAAAPATTTRLSS